MKTRIISIGNSRGIRIPKALLDQFGSLDEVEIHVEGDSLVIHPIRVPSAGREQILQKMVQRGEDKLLDADVFSLTSWD